MSDFKIRSGSIDGPLSIAEPKRPEGVKGFAEQLGAAMGSVEALQLEGDRASDQLAKGGGNLHETALALEKADVAMRVALKVRNKLVDAYHEVMRMSV